MSNQSIGQQAQQRVNSNNNDYARLITNGTVKMVTKKDSGIIDVDSFSFENPCLSLPNKLDPTEHYYLHVIIKRLNTNQIFNIRLASSEAEDNNTQWLKQVKVVQQTSDADSNKNAEVEMIFTPTDNYDQIIFELVRTSEDLEEWTDPTTGEKRYGRKPLIAFIELSTVVNKNPKNTIPLAKIGVQSHPDLMMCINGEEIHLPRSGIFELRDGIVNITFFSVVQASNIVNVPRLALLNEQLGRTYDSPGLKCENFTDEPNEGRERQIDAFVLDYMYLNTVNI